MHNGEYQLAPQHVLYVRRSDRVRFHPRTSENVLCNCQFDVKQLQGAVRTNLTLLRMDLCLTASSFSCVDLVAPPRWARAVTGMLTLDRGCFFISIVNVPA